MPNEIWTDLQRDSIELSRSQVKKVCRKAILKINGGPIIGSKEFVAENYQRFKHLFYSKHEKKPKPVKGLDGVYSLKRLSEIV